MIVTESLEQAKKNIYSVLDLTITDFIEELESKEYEACIFRLNSRLIKFRSAKITPTKTGQFVTLWKRNNAGITEPHDETDPFDLYIISVGKDNRLGQFVFTKKALIENGILSTYKKDGKRGFRVYPPWDITENKQAQKTQEWQLKFFMDVGKKTNIDAEKLRQLYQ